MPGAFHDHQHPLQHRCHPRDQLARIAPVSPDQFQSRKAGDECPEHRFRAVTVLDAGRMDHHDEQETEDINHDVALAPTDALAAVIALDPPFSVVFTV